MAQILSVYVKNNRGLRTVAIQLKLDCEYSWSLIVAKNKREWRITRLARDLEETRHAGATPCIAYPASFARCL